MTAVYLNATEQGLWLHCAKTHIEGTHVSGYPNDGLSRWAQLMVRLHKRRLQGVLTDLRTEPTSSGGPLINDDGEVAAIVVGGIRHRWIDDRPASDYRAVVLPMADVAEHLKASLDAR